MADLVTLRQYLQRVDLDIAEAKARIAGQSRDVLRKRMSGRDPGPAAQQLESWQTILDSMQSHRSTLLNEISVKESTP